MWFLIALDQWKIFFFTEYLCGWLLVLFLHPTFCESRKSTRVLRQNTHVPMMTYDVLYIYTHTHTHTHNRYGDPRFFSMCASDSILWKTHVHTNLCTHIMILSRVKAMNSNTVSCETPQTQIIFLFTPFLVVAWSLAQKNLIKKDSGNLISTQRLTKGRCRSHYFFGCGSYFQES